jgi:mono/diheme cytochrome c family protein
MPKYILYSLLFALFASSCNSDKPKDDKILENNNLPAQNIIAQDTLLPTQNADTTVMSMGEMLFRKNGCASCHHGNQVNNSIGPALGGVTSRRTKAWIYAFTRNSNKMISDGDSTAVSISKEYLGGLMTSYPDLTDAELDSIYSFVEAEYKRNKPVIRLRRVWLE